MLARFTARGDPFAFIGWPNIKRVYQGGAESSTQDTHDSDLAVLEMVGCPQQSESWSANFGNRFSATGCHHHV
jgi:hypothetical protein